MIRTKLFLACALAFVVSLAGTSASAQEPTNQITYFTFSAPFELPGGTTLPAGKYVFKIVDSPSNRHIVQVMSEDQQTMHATLLAIPAQRQEPPDEPEVRFMEAAANAPPAVRTWWYPGRSIGHEFIYPKDHARRLAASQTEGVLTVAGDATGDDAMRTGELARIGRDGQEAAVTAETTTAENTTPAPQTSTAPTPTAEQTASAQTQTAPPTTTAAESATPAPSAATPPAATASAQTTPPSQTAATETTRTELPRTASLLPLIGLLGLGSLLGAGVLRFRR
jgi:hypothetical protein